MKLYAAISTLIGYIGPDLEQTDWDSLDPETREYMETVEFAKDALQDLLEQDVEFLEIEIGDTEYE